MVRRWKEWKDFLFYQKLRDFFVFFSTKKKKKKKKNSPGYLNSDTEVPDLQRQSFQTDKQMSVTHGYSNALRTHTEREREREMSFGLGLTWITLKPWKR